jgi:hypothetical protein
MHVARVEEEEGGGVGDGALGLEALDGMYHWVALCILLL